jgi:hypothetical protein
MMDGGCPDSTSYTFSFVAAELKLEAVFSIGQIPDGVFG